MVYCDVAPEPVIVLANREQIIKELGILHGVWNNEPSPPKDGFSHSSGATRAQGLGSLGRRQPADSRQSCVVESPTQDGDGFRFRGLPLDPERLEVAIITSVDLMIANASSPRRSFRARTASAVMIAVRD